MRGLARRTLAFPVAGGLDTKTDLRWIGPGRWQTLENGFQDKTGRIRKRYGVAPVSRAANTAAGVTVSDDVPGYGALFSLSGGRLGYVTDLGKLFSRYLAYGSAFAGWSRLSETAHGVMGHAIPFFTPVDSTRQHHSNTKALSMGGVTLVAWIEGGSLKVVFIDDLTGQRIPADPALGTLATTQNFQLLSAGGFFVLVYIEGGVLKYARITGSDYGASLVVNTIYAGAPANQVFDAIASEAAGEGNVFYWAQQDNVNAQKIRRGAWNVATGVAHVASTNGGAYASTLAAVAYSVSWFYQKDWAGDLTLTLGVGYVTGTAEARVVKFTRATMAQSGADFLVGSGLVVGPFTITGVAANVLSVGANATVWFDDNGTIYQTDTVLLSAGKTVFANSSLIVTRPFRARVDGAIYMAIAMIREFQPTTYLVQVAKTADDGTLSASSVVVARMLAGSSANGATNFFSSPPVIASVPDGSFDVTMGATFLQAITDDSDARRPLQFYRGAGIIRFRWDRTISSAPQEFANTTYFPGGIVSTLTATGLESHAPLLFPTRASWAGGGFAQAGGGALTAVGVYQYCYVYVYYDAISGSFVRSEASVPESVTLTGANNRVTISLVPLAFARNQSNLTLFHIEVYRTEAGLSQFYKETTVAAPVVNAAAATISYVSTIADSVLVTGERLYTTGGNHGNYPAPPCAILHAHKGRLWAAAADEPNALWYSDVMLPGEGASFNPLKKIKMDQRDGLPTAFASLDDKLVIFKRNSIWVLTGDGPDRRGQGQIYSPPQQIPSEIGTILPRSVAATPEGLIFKATTGGWYRLGRDLAVEYIGAPVEGLNSLSVTGCAVLAGLNQVRWSTSDPFDPNAGTTLVYDYYFKQWSTFTNQAAWSGCGLSQGKWAFMTYSGALMEETTSYSDNGSFISLRLVSPPLSLAGVAGLQRIYGVRLLADYIGDHTLRCKFAYDYAEAYPGSPEQPTIRPSTILRAGNVFQALAKPVQQRGEAIRLEILDEAVAGNTGGFALSSLVLEYGVLPGARRLPSGSVMT